MAFELSRIDRLTKTYDLAAKFPDLDGPFTAADVALLPPRSAPTASTVWYPATVASGIASVLFAGPDADSTGAVVVPASADLWMKVADSPEVDAVKLERITVLGGGAVIAAPTGIPVISVNGKTGAAVVLAAADISGVVADGDGAGGALSGSYPNPGLNVTAVDALVAGAVADGGSDTSVALVAAFGTYINVRSVLGATQSQWPDQLEAAFAANPGGTFFFPDGDYGLNRGITVAHDNSLILAPNARIYATAATSILINHETAKAFPVRDFHELPQSRLITGGHLDGAGLADTVLRCAVFQGLKVENIRITDGIHRGLVVDKNKLGSGDPNMTAEGIFRGLHFMQTTDDFIEDNVAVEALASDNHFHDIVVIDWTTAIRDYASNLWTIPHAWISQAARYPTSVAFDVRSYPRMQFPYSDTYRVGWQIADGCAVMGMSDGLFLISGEFIDAAMNAANPATIFDLGTNAGLLSRGGSFRNYPGATGAAQTTFISNPTEKTTITDASFADSFPGPTLVPGAPGDYYRGRLLGNNELFHPVIRGASVAGTVAYAQNDCYVTHHRDKVSLFIQIQGTFDNTVAGALQITLPLAPTAPAAGALGWVFGWGPGTFVQVGPGEAYASMFDRASAGPTSGSDPITGESVRNRLFNLNMAIDLPIGYFLG